jgi:hypothetical protein
MRQNVIFDLSTFASLDSFPIARASGKWWPSDTSTLQVILTILYIPWAEYLFGETSYLVA